MDKICNEKGSITSNQKVGPSLYLLEVILPDIARKVQPGQFVHMQIPGIEGHILRRPFSVYAANPEKGIIEVLYQNVGAGTDHLAQLAPNEVIGVLGPIGTPWSIPDSARCALLVGGGVGSAPLFMLAESFKKKDIAFDVIIGASTKDALVCHGRYDSLIDQAGHTGSSLSCSTDDGSFGHAGFCTSLVENALAEKNTYDFAAVCGPEPMMKAAVSIIKAASIPCEVSLERRMACGIGACLSCVVETTEGLKRACVDGPIFNASKVVFS